MKTGETCERTGTYRCSTHGNTIRISRGETFPPCTTGGGHGTMWVLVN